MTKKEKKSIKLALWIADSCTVDKNSKVFRENFLRSLNIPDVIESKDGLSAEKAFLLKTNSGVTIDRVLDIELFVKLLIGHKRLALQSKLWEEDIRKGQLSYSDFEDEPGLVKDYVKKLFLRIFPKYWELNDSSN